MPAHRLNPSSSADVGVRSEHAITRVLAGEPLHVTAADAHMDPAALQHLVEVFRQAGRRALADHAAADWWQVHVEFPDWARTEPTAVRHLAPLLRDAHAEGGITSWWFIRKHPCWRLRLHTAHPQVRARLSAELDHLVNAGHLARWWEGVYEPETAAFGGPEGMEAAHQLFHADSDAVLDLVATGASPLGRRELSLLLCSQLLRASSLEWYEQGDAWDHVCRERPLPADVTAEQLHGLVEDVRPLLLADTTPDGTMFGLGHPLEGSSAWADAFDRTGRRLGAAVRDGVLERGLRRVLAYQVIFHWNRLGLSTRAQAAMAWAARAAILHVPEQDGRVRP